MTRLTNHYRGKITDMIISHKFKPLWAALDREQIELGVAVYEDTYSPQLRRAMQEVTNTPTRPKGVTAFGHSKEFKVNAGGWTIDLKLSQDYPFLQGHFRKLFGYNSEAINSYEDETPLCKQLQDYAQRRKATAEQEKVLREQVSLKLLPFFTFDKVREAWPEVERFVSAVEAGVEAPSSLPAVVDNKALNEALDLPPETKALGTAAKA